MWVAKAYDAIQPKQAFLGHFKAVAGVPCKVQLRGDYPETEFGTCAVRAVPQLS